METLQKFKERVYDFEYHSIYLDGEGCFRTRDSLSDKVDEEGNLCPYLGNTTVFAFNEKNSQMEYLKKRVVFMQEVLYTMCRRMLAVRLQTHTLHMTLHDLKNGVLGKISKTEIRTVGTAAKNMLDQLKKDPWIIRLRTTCVFNLVNTSVVLGLEPCTDEDCRLLMGLYDELEKICPLGHSLTPHITLAYYKPGVYQRDDIKKLGYVFESLSEEKLTAEFHAEDLLYQEFYDMNHYCQSVFR